jgi:PPK2 family polyphosphate:nucleotide phosphotransferase
MNDFLKNYDDLVRSPFEMQSFVESPYLVPSDGYFNIAQTDTSPGEHDDVPSKKECKKRLKKVVAEIDALQRMMYAFDHHSVLLVFQAMDAAGKDSTIRAVPKGLNPAGCQVHSFKKPTSNELDHDFLWRTTKALPQRGRIGIFNRSHYEEVLVARVHPNILVSQCLPHVNMDTVWQGRYESINDMEQHLAKNGTVVIKFWLNVSKEEQKNRFMSRLDEPEKHWKFSEADIDQRQHWDQYMHAYDIALRETSKPWAPWYAIPADNKPFMRLKVAEIILATMQDMHLHYPEVLEEEKSRFEGYRARLNNEAT